MIPTEDTSEELSTFSRDDSERDVGEQLVHFYRSPKKARKNMVVLDVLTSHCYRILYVPPTEDPRTASGYWIRIDSNSNIPLPFDIGDIEEGLNTGILECVADPMAAGSGRNLSPKSAAHRDKAWSLIQNIVKLEPDIYDKSRRACLLKTVETAAGVKARNLYGYLGRYWRGGFRIDALNPEYDKCGGVRPTEDLAHRAGRHKRAGENGKVLTEKDIQNFENVIRKFYLQNKGVSLKEAYRFMLSRDYVHYVGDAPPISMGADEKPSYTQFYYWYNKNKDVVGDTLAREGEYNFMLRHRSILGRSEMELFGPGDCYQVDATIGDFHLVMKSDRSRLVGRPVIVLFKDVWSRMVTGVAVVLDNSSCRVWKTALLNTISSKVSLCLRFGIKIQEDEWPCKILPVSITTDNGEFAVQAVDAIVRDLGITVENCPPYRGDLKGIIERVFKTLQLKIRPYIPGYVDKDAGERGAEDYRKKSCLDYESFVAVLIKVILFYNNHHYLEKYHRTEDMREKGIPSIPIHLWNYGIARRTGILETATVDTYADALFERGDATVTPQGIRLNSLYYTCSEAREGKWFEKARISGNYEIPVRYNPFDLDNIYLKGSEGKYVTCPLVNSYADRRGYDKETIEASHQKDLETKSAFAQDEDQAYAEVVQFVKTITERCEKEKQAGKVIIETLKKHSIVENREEERKNINGEAQARQAQAVLGLESSSQALATEGDGQERPKSYSTVSDEIDRMMEGLGFGIILNKPKE